MTSDVVHGSSCGSSLRAGTSARALMALFLLVTTAQFLNAQTFTVLHTFEGQRMATVRDRIISMSWKSLRHHTSGW